MHKLIRHWVIVVTLIFFCCILWSCDDGIAPITTSSGESVAKAYGFRGTVDFRNWPPQDSIVDLRVVAFISSSPSDIIGEVLSGRAEYSETLQPYAADSIPYTLYLRRIQPGLVRYIVVAQQYGPDIQADWRVLTLYNQDADTTKPDSLLIIADSVLTGINLLVDFNNIPLLPE